MAALRCACTSERTSHPSSSAVAASQAEHYAHRDLGLLPMSFDEYTMCMQVVRRPSQEASAQEGPPGTHRRPPASTLPTIEGQMAPERE